jgi:hypothetical protein
MKLKLHVLFTQVRDFKMHKKHEKTLIWEKVSFFLTHQKFKEKLSKLRTKIKMFQNLPKNTKLKIAPLFLCNNNLVKFQQKNTEQRD